MSYNAICMNHNELTSSRKSTAIQLQQLRYDKKLSVQMLSEQSGINKKSIYRLETGDNVDSNTLHIYAHALGAKISINIL